MCVRARVGGAHAVTRELAQWIVDSDRTLVEYQGEDSSLGIWIHEAPWRYDPSLVCSTMGASEGSIATRALHTLRLKHHHERYRCLCIYAHFLCVHSRSNSRTLFFCIVLSWAGDICVQGKTGDKHQIRHTRRQAVYEPGEICGWARRQAVVNAPLLCSNPSSYRAKLKSSINK